MIDSITREKNLTDWMNLCPKSVLEFTEIVYTNIQDMRNSGKTIYPAQDNIYAALELVNPKDVKAVIIGQDPYHEPNQAMGLAFSVSDGTPVPRSLKNIYKELQDDIGCQIPDSGDLTKWAEQGVLLLNTVLTVEAHKANSHKNLGWQALTSALLSVVNSMNHPVVFVCWGSQADKTLKDVFDNSWGCNKNHCVIRSTHPSPLSANKSTKLYPAFMGSKPFSKVNSWLSQHGSEPIDWDLN